MGRRGRQGPLSKVIRGAIGLGTEVYAAHKEKKAAEQAAVASASSLASNQIPTDPPSYEQSQYMAEGPSTFHHQDYQTKPTVPESSAQHRSRSSSPGSDAYSSYDDSDSDDWERDETQSSLPPQDQGPTTSSHIHDSAQIGSERPSDPHYMDMLIEETTRNLPPPSHEQALQKLPVPVIIPQRRPGSKDRGFVRAYAPLLEESGIGQRDFIDFLVGFEKSLKASPYINVLNLAAAVSFQAQAIAVASSMFVHLAALAVETNFDAGRQLYMTNQHNKYLTSLNETYFKPRGLYAMIMAWKPNTPLVSTMNINDNLTASAFARQGGERSNYRSSSSTTHGQAQMPECAPLIFPSLEAASDERKLNAWKSAVEFRQEYWDRREQATFAHENPNSSLNTNAPQNFSTRWADPTSTTNQGGLLAVLSGGHVGRSAMRERRRGREGRGRRREGRRGRRSYDDMGSDQGYMEENSATARHGQRSGERRGPPSSVVGSVRRKLSPDVLYFIIVNMPTGEEMKEAVAMQERLKHAQPGLFGS